MRCAAPRCSGEACRGNYAGKLSRLWLCSRPACCLEALQHRSKQPTWLSLSSRKMPRPWARPHGFMIQVVPVQQCRRLLWPSSLS